MNETKTKVIALSKRARKKNSKEWGEKKIKQLERMEVLRIPVSKKR